VTPSYTSLAHLAGRNVDDATYVKAHVRRESSLTFFAEMTLTLRL